MTEAIDHFIEAAAEKRAVLLKRSINRHRMVFVQLGHAFEPIRTNLLANVADVRIDVRAWLEDGLHDERASPLLVLDGVETFIAHHGGNLGLGALRERATELVDAATNVLLVSRAPRVAFASVPGSSILEDAALCVLPLLEDAEVPDQVRADPASRLPAFSYVADPRLDELLLRILSELSVGVLSSIDHAFFDVNPRSSEGLRFLSNRECEALRCAGLVHVNDTGEVSLAMPSRFTQLKEALAELLSRETNPSHDLTAVTGGLWYIERTIRRALRAQAIDNDARNWRATVVGGIADEVLRRARLDSNVAAVSVKELRDPIEWLTMGELMEIVTSPRFGGLGVDSVIWRRFSEQLVPVRNRISHMRLTKTGDAETVALWVSLMRQQLG